MESEEKRFSQQHVLGNKIGRLLVFQEWKIISTRITYLNNNKVSGDPFLKPSQSCNNRVNEPRALLPLPLQGNMLHVLCPLFTNR